MLDLDNTLICAEALTDFPFKQRGIEEKVLKFELHDMDGYYIVFERPNLQPFLDYVFANFNVSVFTAASQSYCLFIVDNIVLANKKNRALDFILFAEHCGLAKKHYGGYKNMRLFWDKLKLDGYAPNNTRILDDNPDVNDCQPDLCIDIEAFNVLDKGSENDSVLMRDIMPRLRAFLMEANDGALSSAESSASSSGASSNKSAESRVSHVSRPESIPSLASLLSTTSSRNSSRISSRKSNPRSHHDSDTDEEFDEIEL